MRTSLLLLPSVLLLLVSIGRRAPQQGRAAYTGAPGWCVV